MIFQQIKNLFRFTQNKAACKSRSAATGKSENELQENKGLHKNSADSKPKFVPAQSRKEGVNHLYDAGFFS